MALDPRIVRVSIEVNGQLKTYEGLAIRATGVKYANALQNEAKVSITNLDNATINFIVTETSRQNLNRTPKRITVEAGRKSYGYSKIYVGNIVSAIPTQTQADITLDMTCLTGNFINGNIISRSMPGMATHKEIATNVAKDAGYSLDFNVVDKQIANYSYSGVAGKQIDAISKLALVDTYVDNDRLIIKEKNRPLPGQLKIVSLDTGMIEKPELNQFGVKVKFLLDNQTVLGGGLRIISKTIPAANGDYVIYKLSFDIANRDTPFYWIAEALRYGQQR